MKTQRGFGMLGNILVLFMLILGVLLAFKLFPPYTEYYTIQRVFKALAVNPGPRDGKAVRTAFERRAAIDNITAIKPDDLEVGNAAISAKYWAKVPLFGNVSLVLEFNPSSAD